MDETTPGNGGDGGAAEVENVEGDVNVEGGQPAGTPEPAQDGGEGGEGGDEAASAE